MKNPIPILCDDLVGAVGSNSHRPDSNNIFVQAWTLVAQLVAQVREGFLHFDGADSTT
jgi:hypothetical protein